MAQWGKNDATSNSVLWAPAGFNLPANSANRDALYGNTTADAFVTGETVGMYGVSTAEMSGSAGVGSITVVAPGTGFTVRPTVTFDNTGTNGTGVAGNTTAKVVTATINNPGTSGSYVPGDNLTVAGGTSTVAAIANVTHTEVRTVAINAAGSGYANGDVVTATTGTGTKATFTVTTGAADTIPASLALTTRGDYTANPTLTGEATTVAPAGGTGLTVDLTTRVKTVAVKTAGSYTVLPTLSGNIPTGGSGTGATIDLAYGLAAVTLTANGSGYTSAPAVSIGGAGGSGANAVAVLITSAKNHGAHAGWNIRKEGTGGRAGRVQWETLVAMGSITGDAADDAVLPE